MKITLSQAQALLASPIGILLTLTLWPTIVCLLGLPTGAAEAALSVYKAQMGLVVPCAPTPLPPAVALPVPEPEPVAAPEAVPAPIDPTVAPVAPVVDPVDPSVPAAL